VLKLACLYIFPRRRKNGTIVAPPVGRSRIGNQGQKIDCASFSHISTSGSRETGNFQCFFAIMHGIGTVQGGYTVCVTGSLGDRQFTAA